MSAAPARHRSFVSTATELRALLTQRFPDAVPVPRVGGTAPVPLGVAALEHAFPAGGLPRGRLTAWLPQGGATAILRAACRATTTTGERSAWIDSAGHMAPDWDDHGPLLVRPTSRINALRWGEGLLRSGGFALVVVMGAEPQGTETVRLARAAHEGGAALVALTTQATMAALRVTSRILPHGYRWQRGPFADPAAVHSATIEVRVRAPGWNERAEVVLPVTPYDLRLALNPDLVDRRGVIR